MREQQIICTVCPMGCQMHVVGDGEHIETVEGYTCPRGEKYARSEFVCPVRTLTTTVLVDNGTEPMLPVRTSAPVPKEKLAACMKIIRGAVFHAPIGVHEVLIANIADTGADLIACTARQVK